jgi:hypothetical protein
LREKQEEDYEQQLQETTLLTLQQAAVLLEHPWVKKFAAIAAESMKHYTGPDRM